MPDAIPLALVLGLAGPLLTAYGTWAVLKYRQNASDAAIKGLTDGLAAVQGAQRATDEKLERVRVSQGERLGVLERETAMLSGFQKGMRAAGRRTRTQGNLPAITPEDK